MRSSVNEQRRETRRMPARGLRALWSDEDAPAAVEYAILLGGIAIAIVLAVTTLGTSVAGLFSFPFP